MAEGNAMSDSTLDVQVNWDEDAKVWWATSDDIPGLVTEAETFEDLDRNVRELAPTLLAANDVLRKDETGHITIRLVREERVKIPAE
jgi:predicted RNase H-like HicB family nuclease